jgi:hypothetical protein
MIVHHTFKGHDSRRFAIIDFTNTFALFEVRVYLSLTVARFRATFRKTENEKTERVSWQTASTRCRSKDKLRLFWILEANDFRNCSAKGT